MSAGIINLNDTNPAAPAGYRNSRWQKGATTGTDPVTGYPINPVSDYQPNVGGVAAKTANYTATVADNGLILSFNSGSALTLTLPATAPTAFWIVWIQNIGAGVLTISPNGLNLDGSTSSLTLSRNQGVFISTDGTNYFTERGMGSGAGTTWAEEVPAGTMNGVNKVFTLTNTPTAGSLTLVLNIPQVDGTDFTITANTITYTVAPKASDAGYHQARYQH